MLLHFVTMPMSSCVLKSDRFPVGFRRYQPPNAINSHAKVCLDLLFSVTEIPKPKPNQVKEQLQ